MSEPGADGAPAPAPAGRAASTVAIVVVVLAGCSAAALVVPASKTRSGSGDGSGDLLPVLSMMATVPLVGIGVVLTVAAALGRVRWVAAVSTAMLGLGALMTLPVLAFGKPFTTGMSVSEIVAALAALSVLIGVTRGLPESPPRGHGKPPADPAP